MLRYVNGGHNPPLIVRRSQTSCDVVRLDVGGPVIGLLPSVSYAQGQVTLAPDELIARIMCAADTFAAGAPQHDDMTAVVARVVEDADNT